MKINNVKNILIGLSVLCLVSCGSTSTSSSSIPNAKRTITSIEVVERPVKNVFTIDEIIDLTGLKVKVNYDDATSVFVGPASLDYEEKVVYPQQTYLELSYKGHKTILDNLVFKVATDYYFEGESNLAYWSKPNNRSNSQFVVGEEYSNAHGGKYMGGLSKECFGVSFMFEADDNCDATFTLSSDFRTTVYSQTLTPTEPFTRPLSEIYEFHVNGEKVPLSGDVQHGTVNSFKEITLNRASLRKGVNTLSLTHILRNGENGNIDYIGVKAPTNVKILNYSTSKIECEDMVVSSGADKTNEGNNASKSNPNAQFDNVGNRAGGQSGWVSTDYVSDKEKTVALFINFGLCAAFNMSKWEIYVNNEKVNYVDTFIPYHFWAGIAWIDWNEFYICELNLKQGTNTIKIEKATISSDGTNMDYIVLLSAN